MATPNPTTEMTDFFDFGDAAMPESSSSASRPVSRNGEHRVGCPAFGEAANDGCVYHAFDLDADPSDPAPEVAALTDEFNTDFSSWLPQYQKSAHPCDYCQAKGLECFSYGAGNIKITGCSPCNALFRPCSFSNPEKMPMRKSKTALDTLGSVAEHSEQMFGGLTGRKQLRSLGHMGPIVDDQHTNMGPKKGAAAARFPRAAIKILKDWLIVHIDHPYPTEEEKEQLKTETGLSISQISNWMANTRRRQKARPKRSASPSLRPSTEAINIPPGRTWDEMNPLERWKHSPPENEPAPMRAIVDNVENFEFPEVNSGTSSYRKEHSNDSTGSFSVFRAPSQTSLETGLTAISSGSLGSRNSAYSHGSRHSLGSFSSLNSKERRRRRRMPTRTSKFNLEDGPRLFQCTFCTDRFKSKYDWSRHEKSLHLSLEKWICAPLGEAITCSSSGQRRCVYCDELDPSKEHLETHNHRACEEKGMEARTFYRKDHLRQHLRLMHGCKLSPSMESWKSEAQYIKSRCGFCGINFDKWQDRVDHLAKEFRAGAALKNWKGCRGLDSHVAAQVTNAMPPYLIANESKSPFPFSATNSSSMKHPTSRIQQTDLEYLLPNDKPSSPSFDDKCKLGVYPAFGEQCELRHSSTSSTTPAPTTSQTDNESSSVSPDPYATCWEILTLRLGRFAREHIDRNGANSVTDAMLQSEARLILYDEDDPWHQTAADNLEWLNLFKKAHGLDKAGPHPNTDAHHDILEDLGVRPDARLDPSFDLNNFQCVAHNNTDPKARALAFECSLSGSLAMSRAGQSSIPLSLPGLTSMTTSGVSNLPLTTFETFEGLTMPTDEFGAGGMCIGANGEISLANVHTSSTRTESLPDLACTKALESIITTMGESGGTTTGEPLGEFDLTAWDQMGAFDMATTADTSAGIPVSSGFENMVLNSSDTIDGGMGGLQNMTWDDNELAFDMDLDLDFDLGTN